MEHLVPLSASSVRDTVRSLSRDQLPRLYTEARNALQQASTVEAIREICDRWDAMVTYARRQAYNRQLLVVAKRIRLRAQRRLGQVLDTIPRTHHTGCKPKQEGLHSTCLEMGLKMTEVYRAITFARLPEPEFEKIAESANPPAPSLAERMIRERGPTSPWADSTRALKAFNSFLHFTIRHPNAPSLAHALCEGQSREQILTQGRQIQAWLNTLLETLEPALQPTAGDEQEACVAKATSALQQGETAEFVTAIYGEHVCVLARQRLGTA